MHFAQSEEGYPVANRVAAGLQVLSGIDARLATTGMDALGGEDCVVPGIARPQTQAGGIVVDQRNLLLPRDPVDNLIGFLLLALLLFQDHPETDVEDRRVGFVGKAEGRRAALRPIVP